MNKIKGSIIAKVIAWLVLIASSMAFAGSFLTACFMEDMDIFRGNDEDIRKQQFGEAADRYSALVMSNFQNSQNEVTRDFFADKSFRYGIFKADSQGELNLNDDKLCLEKNFDGQMKDNDVYQNEWILNESTFINYNSGGLFGNYSYYYGGNSSSTMYADRICYDAKGGLFYYRANEEYYPVEQVRIDARIQHQNGGYQDTSFYFYYDYDTRTYHNDNVEGVVNLLQAEMTEENPESYDTDEESEVMAAEVIEEATDSLRYRAIPVIRYDDKAISLLHSEQSLTFNQFDDTAFGYLSWGDMYFSGVRPINGAELTLINSQNIPQSKFQYNAYCYLDENYTLHVEETEESEKCWVVSYVDGEALAQEKQAYLKTLEGKNVIDTMLTICLDVDTDLFVLKEILLDTMYDLRDEIFIIVFATFAIALGCFIFLMCGAGHRRNREELVLTGVDRIPLDILCALALTVCGTIFAITMELSYSSSAFIIFYLTLFTGIVLLCVCMAFLLSVAVRIKAGKWWKNTVIYRIIAWIGKCCYLFMKHIGLLTKFILIFGVWTLIGLFLILVTYDNPDALLVLYFLIKIVEAAVFMFVIVQLRKLQEGSRRMAAGDLSAKVDTAKMFWDFKEHGENLNSIIDGMSRAVDERMKSERFKTELITNVSHDIKTPLTSIINYVDLLAKTEIQDETQKEYLDVLERQSARLKKLIEDLIEASKASTGNLPVNTERLEADVFLTQLSGEFEEKLTANNLDLILNKPEEPVYLNADGRHLWRVVDNLMNNICKYAQPGSRVYINLETNDEQVTMTFRNMSKYPLNISGDELMERFVRGDSSRNTEGNGLGLSIAGSLMELMKGKLELYVDGDLFKVVLVFSQIAV